MKLESSMGVGIRPLSYALGAEVTGVDLREPLDDARFAEIRQGFLQYSLLLFRNQRLDAQQQVAFGSRFGELDPNEGVRIRHAEYPQVLVKKSRPEGKIAGQVWHSDHSYLPEMSTATMLLGVEMPNVGGDTMFTNMYLAYETLSPGMKKIVEGLHGVHFGGKIKIDQSSPERQKETEGRTPPVAHPLVITHPDTGRKALYVGEKVKQIVDLSAEESALLLDYLARHYTKHQFTYRHRWQQDDLLIWDNRCLAHVALGDFDRRQVRHVEKCIVKGTGTPHGYVYEGPLHYSGPRL